jgi:amidase
VEDLILTLPILAGPDWRDARAVAMPLGDPAALDHRRLRVAFYTDNGIMPATHETAETVTRAAQVLAAAGVAVDEARPAGIEQSFDLFTGLMAADDGAAVGYLLQVSGTAQPSPLLQRLGMICHPFAMPTAAFGEVLARWDMFQSTMLAFMEGYDVVLCPVCAGPAMPHDTTFDDDMIAAFSYTTTYNLTGWPSAVVRGGTSAEGLPIGLQVVARPWREDVALAVAQQLEAAVGGWQPPLLWQAAQCKPVAIPNRSARMATGLRWRGAPR